VDSVSGKKSERLKKPVGTEAHDLAMTTTAPQVGPSNERMLTDTPLRVSKGAVDVFLVRRPGNTRFALARFGEGEILFPAAPSASGCVLLACPSPGGELEPVECADDRAWMARMSAIAGAPPEMDLLDALEAHMVSIENRRLAQMRMRAEADRKLQRTAFATLAGALDPGGTQHPVVRSAATPAATLIEAARAVARRAGITILTADPACSIEHMALASGVRVRRVDLPAAWWTLDSGPIVGYQKVNKQAVALLPKTPGSYELWDPETMRRQRVTAAVAATLESHGHCFCVPFGDDPVTLSKLIRTGLRGCTRDAITMSVAGILAGLLGLLTPVLTGKLVDELIPSAKRDQLVEVFAILAFSAIATWILLLLRSLAVLRIEGRMEAALQTAYWDRLLRLPAGFHRGYTAGDLAMRSLGISAIRQTLTGTAVSSILTGVFSLFGLGLMFSLNAALAGIGLVMVILAFAVTVAAAWIQIRLQRSITEKGGRLAGLLPQILGGIAKLRVAAAEDRAFARWAARFADQKRETVRGRRVSTWLQVFFGLFQAGTTMALFMGLFYVSEGRTSGLGLTTGAFLAFQSAFLQVLGGATQIGSALIGVLSVVPLYERAKPILETVPESTTGRADPGSLTGDLELNQIVFRYVPDAPPVLQGVSLRVHAGEFAAIVGPSGSGKSTLLRLLLGFESPESGSVFYDGQDLNGLDLAAVRRQAGVVLQSGGVLHGSIFDNIAGAAQLTMDDAWRAARLAGLEADIRAMPMGMHTLIPDGGLGLSGGQRQRLQIARAIVNQPKLIFFDEATSALDNHTQAIVMESLSALCSTRIVIAHRLSTIRNADRIFVLNKGQIEESGTYDDLMAKKGLFEAMARRQLA